MRLKGWASAGPPGAGPLTEIPSEEVCAEAGAEPPEPRGGSGPGRPEALPGREALEALGLRATPTPHPGPWPGPRERRQHHPFFNRTKSLTPLPRLVRAHVRRGLHSGNPSRRPFGEKSTLSPRKTGKAGDGQGSKGPGL